MCGNYLREETIQGRKLYEEIRYSKKQSEGHYKIFKLIMDNVTNLKRSFSPGVPQCSEQGFQCICHVSEQVIDINFIHISQYVIVAVTSSGILKAKQKLGVTFNSNKLGGIDFTKFSKLTMCSAQEEAQPLTFLKISYVKLRPKTKICQ